MKKTISVLSILFLLAPIFQIKAQQFILFRIINKVSPFVEMQTNNNISLSAGTANTLLYCSPSFAWGVEIPANIERTGKVVGMGIEFQKSEVVDSSISFKNMPVYWFYKQKISKDSSFYIPDIIVKLGYNFLTVSTDETSDYAEKSGLFYAVGLSFNFDKHIDLRITYKSAQGKITGGKKFMKNGVQNIPDDSYSVDNYKLTFGFNILF